MRWRVLSVLMFVVLTMASSFGGEGVKIQKVSDEMLDDVYAQGLFTNWQIIGNFSGNTFNIAGDFTNRIKIESNITSSPINLQDSLFLNGNAQQGAFIPVNAVNSEVNVPVNLVVIFGDNYGNINISNILEAIRH
ncbi:hypothetical protein [Persephonella sp.]